ncbi:MAG: S8 family serine peptidase [Planctomycetota bacterium]|nr:S8 family serine peptidase [Planctomycetota bacterium]
MRSHGSFSRRTSAAHFSPLFQAFTCDALEPRTMFSGEAGLAFHGPLADSHPGVADVVWNGRDVRAIRGEYILTFNDRLGEGPARLLAQDVATRLGGDPASVRVLARGAFALVRAAGTISSETANQVVREFSGASGPRLVGIEPNWVSKSNRVPNDPQYPAQWHLENTGQVIENGFQDGNGNFLTAGNVDADIDAATGWDSTIGLENVVIAVIDTGIDLSHQDLTNNLWVNLGEIRGNGIDDDGNGFVDDVNGFDFGSRDSNPDDDSLVRGHGTEVAGLIGAVGDNGVGLTGVAWNVSLMALKVSDNQGFITGAAIVDAHDYATMMRGRGVNLVASNNSYGTSGLVPYPVGGFASEALAIQRFINSGGIFVTSAGNDALDGDAGGPLDVLEYPAEYRIPGVISVAATNPLDELAPFSSFGRQSVDLAAPGDAVRTTTVDDQYANVSGTSYSAAIVTGMIAVLKSQRADLSATEVRQILIDSSDPLPTLQNRVVSGGRVNLTRALSIASISGPVVRAVNPGPVSLAVDAVTGQPIRTISITFNKPMSGTRLDAQSATLVRAGADGIFGTGDDASIIVSNVAVSSTSVFTVDVTLNVSGLPLARLPVDSYRLTLESDDFRDTDANFLNGNQSAGVDEVYAFRIVSSSGDNEPNDSVGTATPVAFNGSGQARINGAQVGNGTFPALDVDLYRIDLPRGGQIRAEVFAKRLQFPSTLDSVLTLFNAQGQQIFQNDNFGGADSLVDFFVNNAGTYYVGVSGFGNFNYDARVAGSGQSQSRGLYDIAISVALSGNEIFTVSSSLPLPRPLPPQGTQGVLSDAILVSDSRQILDVNVRLNINHTYTQDLEISLISPGGTQVLLVNRRGGSGDNFTGTLLDDEATTLISTGAAPFTGSFRPDTPLSAFDGVSAAGFWTLLINDRAALNVGTLNDWSIDFTLANDIFGPDEPNDTLATARTLPAISTTGFGSVTLSAFLGDGGFGRRDRDIYSFVGEEGSTLTVEVASTSTLDSAIRLFNAQGQEIRVANPSGDLNSAIQSFVLVQGGIYYIAVSEASNLAYNAAIAGTGVNAGTTGTYSLGISVARGVSDLEHVLEGDALRVGVRPGGYLLSRDEDTFAGLRFNNIEFLRRTTNPLEGTTAFFGAAARGDSFRNSQINSTTTTQIPFSLVDQSDRFNQRASTRGTFGGLRVERSASFGVGDQFIAFDVVLTNTSSTTLDDVSWMEGFNPDQGLNLDINTALTLNDLDGRFASARVVNNTFQQGLTIALAAAANETRATTTFVDLATFTLRDPTQILGRPVTDPAGAAGDLTMVIAYDLGDLAAGQSVSFRYFVFFGETLAEAEAQYATLNAGTGAGHLAADPKQPAPEVLTQPSGATVSIPQLPYRLFYSEGNSSDKIFNFVPIANSNSQPVRAVLVARYEAFGAGAQVRDQIIGDAIIPANSRGGFTLNTPDLFNADQQLVAKGVPFALELRSDLPVSATFSYYDLQLTRLASAIGESFSSESGTTWTFGQVEKRSGIFDFVLFYNPQNFDNKVTVTLLPADGTAPVQLVYQLGPYRRGGFDITREPAVRDNTTYGVLLQAERPVFASVTHQDNNLGVAEGQGGTPGLGQISGLLPEGQFGLAAEQEQIRVVNTSTASSQVIFTFLFANGSSYRTVLDVAGRSQSSLDVATLPNFPTGQPYSVLYNASSPVTVDSYIIYRDARNGVLQALTTSPANEAYTFWGFGEGFRPGDGLGHPGVVEYLRLFNPTQQPVTIEINIGFDGPASIDALKGNETFRRTLQPREVLELDVHSLVTGGRRAVDIWYGLSVKSASPIVAYMAHYDAAFPGAFGSVGTKLGLSAPIV